LNQARQKKMEENEKAGKNILMPEVFVSNHMKQQRNFVHYKRNKKLVTLGEKINSKYGSSSYNSTVSP